MASRDSSKKFATPKTKIKLAWSAFLNRIAKGLAQRCDLY